MKINKTILILLYGIWMAHPCTGQDPVSPNNTIVDYLQSLLDSELEDTLKVIRLHELARICFYDLQYERGLVAVRQARQLSAKLKFRNGEGLYLRTMNIFHRDNPLENIYNLRTNLFYQQNQGPEIPLTEFGLPFQTHDPDLAIKIKHLLAYTPTVTLCTKNLGGKIEIRIRDNGPGIPQNIMDKIFQPLPDRISGAGFFTTKPTGQGTGLGLSIAYDIVTKGHGGTLEVDSAKGEGTEFTIQFPC